MAITDQKIQITSPETKKRVGNAEFSCNYKGTALSVRMDYTTDEDFENEGLIELRIRRIDKWPVAAVIPVAIKALEDTLNKNERSKTKRN